MSGILSYIKIGAIIGVMAIVVNYLTAKFLKKEFL